MRIWIVNHYALPPGSSGGPTRHLGLSRELVRRGHEVTVITSAYDHYTRRDHRNVGSRTLTELIDGVTYAWVPTPPYDAVARRGLNMLVFALRAVRYGRRLGTTAPDVVIGSSPHLLTGLAAKRLARRFRVPFVFEVRDIWPASLVDLGPIGTTHPLIRVLVSLERHLYRTAAHVIVVPPRASEHVAVNGGTLSRISTLPNGFDLRNRPRPAPVARHRAHFSVVYAGTVGLANGLEVVVDAAAAIQRRGVGDIRFRIVGAGPERGALADHIDATGVGSLVSLEEPVPSDTIPQLLAEADACLLVLRPSPVFRWGISPTKLFDYMAAARPVVSAVDAPDDASIDAGAGIRCAAGNAEALADTVLALRAMTPDERDAMGERGRAHVEAYYSFEALAARLEACLDGVLQAST